MPGFSVLRVIQVGFKSLHLHKLRSALTMLGMVIGVWAVITLVAIGEGASQDAQEAIKRLGAQNVLIRSIKPLDQKTQSQGFSFTSEFGLKNADATRISHTIPGVKRVLPILQQRKTAVHGRSEVDCQIIGTFPYYPEFTQARIVAGRFLTESDEREKTWACVLTVGMAERLFTGQNPLEETVVIREERQGSKVFRVVGLIEERSTADKMPQDEDPSGKTIEDNIYIPLSTMKGIFGTLDVDRSAGNYKAERVELSEIRVEFHDAEQVLSSLPLIRDSLNKGRDGVKDYEIRVPLNELNALKQQKERDTRMLLYIACISLLVGGIGIMNIMLATVTERTREIGVRRALGATQNDIIVQFLIETIMLCLLGGMVGVMGGWGFAEFRHHILEITTIVKEWSIIVAFGLSGMVGVFFGLYPAIRAANLDPIEALRHA